MPIITGLVSIRPWGTIEWVTVRGTSTADSYRVEYDLHDLFTVQATEQADLLDKITKAWRQKFPKAGDSPLGTL
jgi:hypothetical protein